MKKLIKKILRPTWTVIERNLRSIYKQEEPLKRGYIKSIPQCVLHKLEFHICDSCNLNCVGCNHFSPLAKENRVSYESVEKDLKRIAELFGDKIGTLSILGGEPLMNRSIDQYMDLCRGLFPNNYIRIVTNGLLIPKMEGDFWDACKRNRIAIAYTKYPVKADYNFIEKTICDHEIKYEKMNFIEKEMTIYPIDSDGRQDANMNYYQLCTSNDCTFLKNGKIFPCPYVANIDLFNEYFGKKIPMSDMDYIDIYKVEKAEEIFEFLSRPIPFCRFCIRHNNKTVKWKVSDKALNEWYMG